MKTILVCTLACVLTAASSAQSAPIPEPEFVIRTLSVSPSDVEIIKLNTQSAQCWRLKNDQWEEIPPPMKLPASRYDMSLLSFQNKSWVLTLWDVTSGKTFLYSSVNGKWKAVT